MLNDTELPLGAHTAQMAKKGHDRKGGRAGSRQRSVAFSSRLKLLSLLSKSMRSLAAARASP